jgi:hypothetical protein
MAGPHGGPVHLALGTVSITGRSGAKMGESYKTAVLRAAGMRGASTLDGLGMLVGQVAIVFKVWTGVDAPVDVMRQALQDAFAS